MNALRKNKEVVFESESLIYSQTQGSRKVELHLQEGQLSENGTVISPKFWIPIQSNKSEVFLHALLVKQDSDAEVNEITQKMIKSGEALYAVVGLIKYDVIPRNFRQRYLLSDFDLVKITPLEGDRDIFMEVV